MTKYMLVLLLFAGACGQQSRVAPTQEASGSVSQQLKPCETTPLLQNEDYWADLGGRAAVNCKLTACFPRSLEASIPCDMRCIMTKDGFGQPEAVKRAFEGVKPAQGSAPYFIVAYGPPASGKSSIASFLKRTFPEFRGLDETLVSVDVDDIFQGGEVGEQYKSYRQKISQMMVSPATQQIYLQRLYVYYRWIADQISDQILNLALLGRYNVRWETTGASDWPRHEIVRINNYKYRTIVVYPLVKTDTLIERAKQRADAVGQEAMPAEQIRKTVDLAQEKLIALLALSHVIIIDNNGEPGKETIYFDSARPASFCSMNKEAITRPLEQALTAFAKCRP